jgi:hypothetical protein
MRQIVTSSKIDIRADEIDWMPLDHNGETWHTLVNDEDFCQTKDDKLNLRRQNRKNKRLARNEY